MKTDGVEIVVTGVSEKSYYGKDFNGYTITVHFSIKNNNTEDFEYDPSDIILKTKDSKQKYEKVVHLSDPWFFETLIPGASYNFSYSYHVPYSLSEKDYIACFDLGFFSRQVHCDLFD